MSKELLKCPHCGSTSIIGKVSAMHLLNLYKDENGETKYDTISTSTKSIEYEILKCNNCKANITEADLLTGVKCSVCGKVYPEDDIQDGKCVVCIMNETDKDITNASRDDIIYMLYKERQKNKINREHAKHDAMIEKAEEHVKNIEQEIEENNIPVDEDPIPEESVVETPNTEEPVPEKPAGRKTHRKKKAEPEPTTKEVEEAQEVIEDASEAPFPDDEPSEPMTDDLNVVVDADDSTSHSSLSKIDLFNDNLPTDIV